MYRLEIVTDTTSEESVYRRYAAAAQQREAALCCPVDYNSDLLAAIPDEIVERDYGCGDPTPYAQPGDTVLDLGAGGGKLCYMLAQVVGPQGRVIGVDCNTEMLELARRHQAAVAERIGYANVDFRYGMIQDLRLDLDRLDRELAARPVGDSVGWIALRQIEERLRSERPLVEDESVDCVVSNCVLNLVRQQDRRQLFSEIFRVLRSGGRAAISDIVADEDVPAELQRRPDLWSGCISGAYREDRFLEAFVEAGFHGVQIVKRQVEPWRTVEGIEFRSLTVVAYKDRPERQADCRQAVVYRGPFVEVRDEEGRRYRRGVRTAVSSATLHRLARPPYAGMFDAIEPREPVAPADAPLFDRPAGALRDPRETKGADYRATDSSSDSCCGDSGCC